MKVSNISFGAVTPVIATFKAKQKLTKMLTLADGGYSLKDATEFYRNSLKNNSFIQRGMLADACEKGKKILFLTTGEDYKKHSLMVSGWESLSGLSKRIDRKPVVLNDNSHAKMVELLKRVQSNS